MAPRRHEFVVAAPLHKVGGRFPIDLNVDSQIPSKVRGSQNNKTSIRLSDAGFGGRPRLCWTRACCRRRCFRFSGSGQWRRPGRSHLRAALRRTLQNQQPLGKCLPQAMKNPTPLASALCPESAPRASAVDRLAHTPHRLSGPFPEVCATVHSRGRKAARDRKSSLVRRHGCVVRIAVQRLLQTLDRICRLPPIAQLDPFSLQLIRQRRPGYRSLAPLLPPKQLWLTPALCFVSILSSAPFRSQPFRNARAAAALSSASPRPRMPASHRASAASRLS